MLGEHTLSVHATIIARGGGSTFHRKNTCRILGKPIIAYAIETCQSAGFIDHVFVWSEDAEILDIARSLGAHALPRPRSMVHYYSGFATQQEWSVNRSAQIDAIAGGPGEVNVAFNCNNFLLRPETLAAMHDHARRDEAIGGVIAVSAVPAGLCLKTRDGALFPFWNDPSVPQAEHPPLYRRTGVAVTIRERFLNGRMTLAPHVVSREEAFDLQHAEEVPLAEYYMQNRLGLLDSSGMPAGQEG